MLLQHSIPMASYLSMQRSRARPDPVSCQLCRSKKLRCNRVQPCSNCTTQGTSCTYLVPPQRRQAESTNTGPSNADLLERIERLEALVSSGLASDTRPPTLAPSSWSIATSDVQQRRRESDLELLENIGIRDDTLVRESFSWPVRCL